MHINKPADHMNNKNIYSSDRAETGWIKNLNHAFVLCLYFSTQTR